NAHYLTRIGDVSPFLRLGGPTDVATGDRGRSLRHFLACQHFVKGNGQIATRRRGAAKTDAPLIVDAALITNDPIGVEDERFRRPLRAELVGDAVAHIF